MRSVTRSLLGWPSAVAGSKLPAPGQEPSGAVMESGFSVNQRALPGAVPAVRAAVSGFLDPYDLSPTLVADVGLAVTEACANVVRHAYPDGPGELRCEAAVADDEVIIRVSDDGCGVDARSCQPGLGLGLRLMGMLAQSAAIARSDGQTVV